MLSPYYEDFSSDAGENAPVLLIFPGVSGGVWMFREMATFFKKTHRVVVFNNPGIGGAPLLAEMRVPKIVDLFKQIIEKLGIEKADVIGHSMGGFIAQCFTSKNPDMVKKMVIISSSYGRPQTEKDVAKLSKILGVDMWDQKKISSLDDLDVMYEVSPNFKERDPEAYEKFYRLRKENKPDELVLAAHLSCGALFSSISYVRKINTPTLLIHGEDDLVVSYQSGVKLAGQIPQARCLTYKECGHFPFFEYDDVCEQVTAFLNGQAVGDAVDQEKPVQNLTGVLFKQQQRAFDGSNTH